MSLLDDVADDVSAALSGELRSATIWQLSMVPDGGGGFSEAWTAAATGGGLRASYDAEYAAQSGIPRENVRIELLASSFSVAPKRLDVIQIEGCFWQITEIETDPATAMWICQCAETTDPTA